MTVTKEDVLKRNSRILRRDMTREERHLWYDFLKKLPITVNRQKIIGPYIVDFYCHSVNTVIELDGSQHYKDENRAADKLRDEYLKSHGMVVLRYSNLELNTNFDGVCTNILGFLGLTWDDVCRNKDGEREIGTAKKTVSPR